MIYRIPTEIIRIRCNMDDELLHIRVSKKLKDQMQVLIDEGYFNNYTEIVREGIRSTVIKFKEEIRQGRQKKP